MRHPHYLNTYPNHSFGNHALVTPRLGIPIQFTKISITTLLLITNPITWTQLHHMHSLETPKKSIQLKYHRSSLLPLTR